MPATYAISTSADLSNMYINSFELDPEVFELCNLEEFARTLREFGTNFNWLIPGFYWPYAMQFQYTTQIWWYSIFCHFLTNHTTVILFSIASITNEKQMHNCSKIRQNLESVVSCLFAVEKRAERESYDLLNTTITPGL